MKTHLSQNQRILTASIYLIILLALFQSIGVGVKDLIWGKPSDENVWLYSGALLIILGKYVAQPYFTKPTEAVVNSFAVIISLLTLSSKESFIWFNAALIYSSLVLLISIIAIVLNNKFDWPRAKRITYLLSSNLGDSKVIFSVVYLLAAVSYFGFVDDPDIVTLILILAFWICIAFFDLIGIVVVFIAGIFKSSEKYLADELGVAIGCENPLLYKVEVNTSIPALGTVISIQSEEDFKSVGILINVRHLLNTKWLEVYLLENQESKIIQISTKYRSRFLDKSKMKSFNNLAHTVDIDHLPASLKKEIEESLLYENRKNIVGYVDQNSNLEKIDFHILSNSKKLKEGDIIEASIYGKETKYQVIGAVSKEEDLERKDKYGYINGIARKLGIYDEEKSELETIKWLPNIYSPVYKISSGSITDEELKEIADTSVGRLPGTGFKIPIKDLNSLVTHNTAILGILGIGKSCLSYELISKVVITDVKVICIDITGEYIDKDKGLPKYVNPEIINYGVDSINDELDKIEIKTEDSKEDGGNVDKLMELLIDDFETFYKSDKKIRVLNPDEIIAIQQRENAKNRQKQGSKDWEMYAPFSELTVAEVTRVMSEASLSVCKELGITDKARLQLVYEEAHSLAPEWNSVANDGDKYATNGTAKVILQGRKYGLGCLLISQRTANVSKSILNQCNTIFSLRIFDDTGKDFLSNYFGKDYASILPSLNEREAVVIGRGLKLKQPVIIELNHLKYLVKPDP